MWKIYLFSSFSFFFDCSKQIFKKFCIFLTIFQNIIKFQAKTYWKLTILCWFWNVTFSIRTIPFTSNWHRKTRFKYLLTLESYCFFFFVYNFSQNAARCAHFFVWLENVIFLLVIHIFWWGYFFRGLGGSPSPNDFGPPHAENCFENISLKKKKKNTSLEIANSLSCEHVSELSNGRQLCTFLGFFSCLAHCGRKQFGRVPFGSARGGENFWRCLFCFKKLPVILLSRIIAKSCQLCPFLEFQKAANYTHFYSKIPKSCQLSNKKTHVLREEGGGNVKTQRKDISDFPGKFVLPPPGPVTAWCFFWGGAIDFEGGPSKFISAPPSIAPPQKMAPPQCPPSKHAIFLTTGGPPSNFPKCPPSKWLPSKWPPSMAPPRKKHHGPVWPPFFGGGGQKQFFPRIFRKCFTKFFRKTRKNEKKHFCQKKRGGNPTIFPGKPDMRFCCVLTCACCIYKLNKTDVQFSTIKK